MGKLVTLHRFIPERLEVLFLVLIIEFLFYYFVYIAMRISVSCCTIAHNMFQKTYQGDVDGVIGSGIVNNYRQHLPVKCRRSGRRYLLDWMSVEEMW